MFFTVVVCDPHAIRATFRATDQSGIGAISTYLDGTLRLPYEVNQNATHYELVITNLTLQIGDHVLRVEVWDGDTDRAGDALMSALSTTFQPSVVMALHSIVQQLEILQGGLPDNLSSCLKAVLNSQLAVALNDVQWSITAYNNAQIRRAVLLEKLAKVHLTISNMLVEISARLDRVDMKFAEAFVTTTHDLRDQLTLIMGSIVATPLAVEIATVEVKILQFADELYQNLTLLKSFTIDLNLWRACAKLDQSLLKLAAENQPSAEAKIQGAITSLGHAQGMVNLWKTLGCLSEEVATSINAQIDQFILELTGLLEC